jgi:type II secretory pathway component GspD/PulD (secretin)
MRKRKKISMAVLLLLAAAPALSAEMVAFKDGLLTVQARNLPLKQILQQIADQTGAEITLEGRADNAVSADFAETDLAAALLRLAPDFNSIVLYGGAGLQDKTAVSAIRLYAISARPNKDDVITFSPKTAGR